MDHDEAPLTRFQQEVNGPKIFGLSGTPIQREVVLPVGLPGELVPAATTTISPDIPRKSSPVSIAPSDQSTVSSPCSRRESILSRKDTSSSATTVSDRGLAGETLEQQIANMELPDDELVYGCPFNFIGCTVDFLAHEYSFDNWYSHSLWHFKGRPLPTYTRCIFCSETFENENPTICWRQRMCHIAGHLENGRRINADARPDFALIKHLFEEGVISATMFEALKMGCERPHLDGFRPYNYIPESMLKSRRAQEEEENRIEIKERRRRTDVQHFKSSKGKRKTARITTEQDKRH